jgi:hypothetical protein
MGTEFVVNLGWFPEQGQEIIALANQIGKGIGEWILTTLTLYLERREGICRMRERILQD